MIPKFVLASTSATTTPYFFNDFMHEGDCAGGLWWVGGKGWTLGQHMRGRRERVVEEGGKGSGT